MPIFRRLWLTASLTMTIAIMLFVGLTLLQFRNIQRTLLTERVAVLARNTAEPFEASLGLGLPLSSVRNAEALLERARQTDDMITSIHLVAPDGRVLRRIGAEEANLTTLFPPGDWSSGAASRFEGTRFLSLHPISGPAGGSPGAIVVSLDAGDSVIRLWAIGAELAAAAVVFLIVGTLVTGLVLRRVFAVEILAFDAVETDIDRFERDMWRGHSAGAKESGGFHRLLTEARSQYLALAAPQDDGQGGR